MIYPFDYCQTSNDTISILSPDDQCANYRSGILCGACQENYSIVLGGSKCMRCTSEYTFIWITILLAAAGIALIAFLLICNITISAGTLNGLIFYANVVSISGLMNLRNCFVHSVFIAWVNLDLGIETCFYPGMDSYQKTWLQFAFPIIYMATCGCNNCNQLLLLHSHENIWQKQHCYIGHSFSSIVQQDAQDYLFSTNLHSNVGEQCKQRYRPSSSSKCLVL